MIRYKVTNLFRGSFIISSKSYFYVKYKKGAVLEDNKGGGYFLFETREDAENFNKKKWIIRVETLSEEIKPKEIKLVSCFGDLFEETTDDVPEGTVCCKKIKVLD